MWNLWFSILSNCCLKKEEIFIFELNQVVSSLCVILECFVRRRQVAYLNWWRIWYFISFYPFPLLKNLASFQVIRTFISCIHRFHEDFYLFFITHDTTLPPRYSHTWNWYLISAIIKSVRHLFFHSILQIIWEVVHWIHYSL